MKKGFVSILVLLLAFLAFSCGSTPPATTAAAGPSNTPDWLNDFPPEDAIWGIGTAKQSSPQMSMDTAEQRARVSVARQLNSKIDAMFTDYNKDAGVTGSQANASMQENVSRNITRAELTGSRPIKRWQAPDGTWWYLVEYKKSDAKSAVAGILNNEQAAFAEFKASQALQMMDAQFAKNEKPADYVVNN